MPFITSKNVILPGDDRPQPATLVVDSESGTIVAITNAYNVRDSETFRKFSNEQWIDLGDKFLLPGLVECAPR